MSVKKDVFDKSYQNLQNQLPTITCPGYMLIFQVDFSFNAIIGLKKERMLQLIRLLRAYKAKFTDAYVQKETYEKVDEPFQSIYIEVVSLAYRFDTEEKEPNVRGWQMNRKNIPSEIFKKCLQTSVHLPFLDFVNIPTSLQTFLECFQRTV